MNTALKQFNKSIDTWSKAVPPEIVKVAQKKMTLQLLGDLLAGTPVDTGRARANWQVGINSVPSGEIATVSKEKHKSTNLPTIRPADRATEQKAMETLVDLPLFAVVFITNNVPYIEVLERGRRNGRGSLQAPNGWIRTAVKRTTEIFK